MRVVALIRPWIWKSIQPEWRTAFAAASVTASWAFAITRLGNPFAWHQSRAVRVPPGDWRVRMAVPGGSPTVRCLVRLQVVSIATSDGLNPINGQDAPAH